jgi:DNA (cytosine-5)-methyltransferase 1
LLDLFCGAGGATKGYQRAGFEVIGVDIKPQPRYCGDLFIQADAMEVLTDREAMPGWWDTFDAVHASPPCQDHTRFNPPGYAEHGTGWMLAATIDHFASLSIPWVVENVVAPTVTMNGWWFTLCGSSFGLRVRRHRRFGSSLLMLAPDCQHREQGHPVVVTGGRLSRKMRAERPWTENPTADEARAAMGIDWMTRDELSQAIPPTYTEWIGEQLLTHLEAAA